MRCFQGRLFTVDGMIEDEAPLKKEIYEQVRYYATTSVARRIEHIMQAIKLACASEPPEIQTDRIHVRNGTYFVDGHFTPEKEYCMNRLPIALCARSTSTDMLAEILERTAIRRRYSGLTRIHWLLPTACYKSAENAADGRQGR